MSRLVIINICQTYFFYLAAEPIFPKVYPKRIPHPYPYPGVSTWGALGIFKSLSITTCWEESHWLPLSVHSEGQSDGSIAQLKACLVAKGYAQ